MKTRYAIFWLLPSAVLAADTNDVPALIPPYPEISTTFWQQHQVAIIIGGFLFIIVQSLWLYKLLMRLQPKVEPVENLTRAALNQLLNEPEDGRLLSKISGILRDYFGKQYLMAGEEATSAEFIAALERNPKLDGGLKARVAAFLHECDAQKFSPGTGIREIDAAERALDLVDEAEKGRAGQIRVTA